MAATAISPNGAVCGAWRGKGARLLRKRGMAGQHRVQGEEAMGEGNAREPVPDHLEGQITKDLEARAAPLWAGPVPVVVVLGLEEAKRA